LCGAEPLDRYFQQQAGQESRRNVARVFVLNDPTANLVIGYYTLSMTSIETAELPVELTRRLPRYPVTPAAIIGRLATDSRYRGQGFGTILLLDALRRILETSEQVAAFAVVVDAKDDSARRFYEHHDFRVLTDDGRRLLLPIETVAQMFDPRTNN
jgi:GNAT superfamily N-acetyltransferase